MFLPSMLVLHQTDQRPAYDIRISEIPMRDGIKLRATVYLPHGFSAKSPAVFTLTPYRGDSYHARGVYFASHGLPFLLVDCRGRGNSDGTFAPLLNEGQDGCDVVEWIAKQPYCNGKVGMWGGSYAGFDQWSTIKELPPHLSTIVPAAAVKPGVDFPSQNGVVGSYAIQWLTFTAERSASDNLFGDGKLWSNLFYEFAKTDQPFRNLDQAVGMPSPAFQRWLSTAPQNADTDAAEPTAESFSRMTQPILTITGHYDGDQLGALSYYRDHMRYGSAAAKSRHFLIIGPWDHAGTRTPVSTVGGLTFGPASLLDLNDLHRQWYEWTMGKGARPKFLEKRVASYLAGPDKWVFSDTLEGLTARMEELHLCAGPEGATDIYSAGELSAKPAAGGAPLTFTYDPKDHRWMDLEQKNPDADLTDQTELFNPLGGALIFHSSPLKADTDYTGVPNLKLWVQVDVPDLDLGADLYLIRPTGQAIQLTSAVLRCRWRESLRTPKLMPLNEPVLLDLSGFNFFSRRVEAGSRFVLAVTCPRGSETERNFCSGKPVETESGADARIAHVRVLCVAGHRSVLSLPVAASP